VISVIIPSYNYGHFIGQAIEGIIAQTYRDWEILVIDDDSRDNTEEVVRKYSELYPQIHYFWQANAGPSAARNRGIDNMKGEYVQFLDPDDLFEKRKFEEQIRIFEENQQADIVYSSMRYFTKDPYDEADRRYSFWGVDKEWVPKFQGRGSSFLPQALKGNFTHFSSMLFRRRIIEKAGRFDEINNAPSDYTYILQCVISDAYFMYHDTPETYGLIRWHTNNLSKNLDRMMKEEINARHNLAQYLKGNREAMLANDYAIKAYRLKLNKSWKTVFLSGGKFDFLKKIISSLGLKKLAQKIFYQENKNIR